MRVLQGLERELDQNNGKLHVEDHDLDASTSKTPGLGEPRSQVLGPCWIEMETKGEAVRGLLCHRHNPRGALALHASGRRANSHPLYQQQHPQQPTTTHNNPHNPATSPHHLPLPLPFPLPLTLLLTQTRSPQIGGITAMRWSDEAVEVLKRLVRREVPSHCGSGVTPLDSEALHSPCSRCCFSRARGVRDVVSHRRSSSLTCWMLSCGLNTQMSLIFLLS